MGVSTLSVAAVTLLLLATAVQCAEIGEFCCDNNEKCIDKSRQCDDYVDCVDGTDEQGCTVIGKCQLDQLQCTVNGNLTCFDIATDICVNSNLDSEPKCDNGEDVQHCRCGLNYGITNPYRCPSDGECYESASFCDFCDDDPLACGDDVTAEECDADPEYFSCISSKDTTTPICLPIAAQCDSYKHCYGSEDDPKNCKAPSIITNQEPMPDEYYMGDSFKISYMIQAFPRPEVLLYHYNKLVSTPLTANTTTVNITLTPYLTFSDYFTLTLSFDKLSKYVYGSWDIVMWNVVSEPIADKQTYVRRELLPTIDLDFAAGRPSVAMVGVNGSSSLPDQLTLMPGEKLFISCTATGYPAPAIDFMRNSASLDLDYSDAFSVTRGTFDPETKSVTDILTFLTTAQHESGLYSCYAANDIKDAASSDSVNITAIRGPVWAERSLNGAEITSLYTEISSNVTLVCTADGFPSPTVGLYNVTDGVETQLDYANAPTISYHKDNVKDIMKLRCKATSAVGAKRSIISEDFLIYPVSEPEIGVQGAGLVDDRLQVAEGTELSLVLTLDISRDDDSYDLVLMYTDYKGSEVDITSYLSEITGPVGEIVTQTLTIPDVHLNMTGRLAITLNNTLFAVSKTIEIMVTAPLTLVAGMQPKVGILSTNVTLTFKVRGHPFPAAADQVWTHNGTDITDDLAEDEYALYRTESTYWFVRSYTLVLYDVEYESAGDYVVTLDNGHGAALTDSVTLTVKDDPCFEKPCMNNGTCQSKGESDYECICPDNFSGKNCDVNNWCDSDINLCQNGAECITKDFPVKYRCNCTFAYEGYNCEDQIQFCEARGGKEKCGEATNIGICMNTYTEPDGYFCFCKHSAGGLYCDLTQLCTPNPCKNDGVCTVTGTGADRVQDCECADGYTGDFCEDVLPGYCGGKCNDRAYCDGDSCLCDLPYYGDNCENQMTAVRNLEVGARGYLHFTGSATLGDSQFVSVPLSLPSSGSAGQLLQVNFESSEDMLVISVDGDSLSVTGTVGAQTVESTVSGVELDTPLTLSVTIFLSKVGIRVSSHGSNRVEATGLDFESNLGVISGVQVSSFESGTMAVLTGAVVLGSSPMDLLSAQGRNTNPLGHCDVEKCLNGGTCDESTGSCNCPAEYTGPQCEEMVECSKGCMNGGRCLGKFCVCPLGFHGALCEGASLPGDTFRMRDGTGEVTFLSDDEITSLAVSFTGVTRAEADGTVLQLGGSENNLQIVAHGASLYAVFTRGEYRSVVEGVTNLSQLEFIVADDGEVQIQSTNGAVVTHRPSGTALPPYTTFTIYGNVFADATFNISGDVSARSGSNVIVGTEEVSACPGGSTERMGAAVACTGCPDGTNPVTCGAQVCDHDTCHGTCAANGECVCEKDRFGANCEYGQVLSDTTLVKTTSPHTSWILYNSPSITPTDTLDLIFYMKLDDLSQSGLVALLVSETDPHQKMALYMHGSKMVGEISCTAEQVTTLSVEGAVVAGEWTMVMLSLKMMMSTLEVGDLSDQVYRPACYLNLGQNYYLGGAPGHGGVMATFATPNLFLPVSSTLMDASGVEVSYITICNGPFSPCSYYGASACVDGEDSTFTCTCKSGWKGPLCGTAVLPCEEMECGEGAVCAQGQCVCNYPALRTEDGCVMPATTPTGFCLDTELSYMSYQNNVLNGFDLRLMVHVDPAQYATLNSTTYFPIMGLDVGGVILPLYLVVEYNNETYTLSYMMKIDAPELDFTHESTDVKMGWNTIRVSLNGAGGVVEINEDSTLYREAPILYVPELYLSTGGSTTMHNSAPFPGCYSRITLNGSPLVITQGWGVSDCSAEAEKLIGEQDIGSAELWAKVLLL